MLLMFLKDGAMKQSWMMDEKKLEVFDKWFKRKVQMYEAEHVRWGEILRRLRWWRKIKDNRQRFEVSVPEYCPNWLESQRKKATLSRMAGVRRKTLLPTEDIKGHLCYNNGGGRKERKMAYSLQMEDAHRNPVLPRLAFVRDTIACHSKDLKGKEFLMKRKIIHAELCSPALCVMISLNKRIQHNLGVVAQGVTNLPETPLNNSVRIELRSPDLFYCLKLNVMGDQFLCLTRD